MPYSFRSFRSVKTNLKLNGPTLRYILDPIDTQESYDGSATFSANVIAEFPGTKLAADGTYRFEWFYDNNKVTSNDEFFDIESFNSSSRLTVTNIDYLDEGKEVYCLAYYNAANREGKAVNSPLKSDVAKLSAYPEIVVTKDPDDQRVGTFTDAKYSCDSVLTPSDRTPQDQEYRWQIDGVDIQDGTFDFDGVVPTSDVLYVTSDKGDEFEIDFGEISIFKGFKTNRTYTIFSSTDVTTRLYAVGGGGGASGYARIKGSAGGSVQGNFTFVAGKSYKLRVGAAGGDGGDYGNGKVTVPGGFPGGGDSPSLGQEYNRAGGGGGYTGLFIDDSDGSDETTVTHDNAILIAGGGGGSTSRPARGGDGGGQSSVLGLGDVHTDSKGNVLILSNTTSYVKDIVKTTGRVSPGTNSCLDDTRWQSIIDYAKKNEGVELFSTLDGRSEVKGRATGNNIRRMINANVLPLRRSLTGWVNSRYYYQLLCLAWDENSGGFHGFGLDYSILSWTDRPYRFGYYGYSANPFFQRTTYYHQTANWWVKIPGGSIGQGVTKSVNAIGPWPIGFRMSNNFNNSTWNNSEDFTTLQSGDVIQMRGTGNKNSKVLWIDTHDLGLNWELTISKVGGNDNLWLRWTNNPNASWNSMDDFSKFNETIVLNQALTQSTRYIVVYGDNAASIDYEITGTISNLTYTDFTDGSSDGLDSATAGLGGGFGASDSRGGLGGHESSVDFTTSESRTGTGGINENPEYVPGISGWYTRTGGYKTDPYSGARTIIIKWDGVSIGSFKPNELETITGTKGIRHGGYFYVPSAYIDSTYGWCTNDAQGTCISPKGDDCNAFNIVRYPFTSLGTGSKLQGAHGEATIRGSAGGGGGYYGGGSGDSERNGAGGGGSGYFDPVYISQAGYSRQNSALEAPNVGGDGSFKIQKIADRVTSSITVSGSGTKNLTLNTGSALFGSEVRCKITSDTAQFTTLYTEPANFQVIQPRPVIVMEAYDTVNGKFKSAEFNLENLDNGQFTLDSDTFGSDYNIITFYSKETNFEYYLKVSASAGADKGSFKGGEGGTSHIKINAKKDTEYTILGVSNNSGVFIYEKSRLVAVVGQGGGAGLEGDGGDGGGVNVDGTPGTGRNPGLGGVRPVTGTLELSGSYGSILSNSKVSLYDGDEIESLQSGGRTISCSRGSYYINQGLSPCEDISENPVQFIDNSGRVYSESSSITRGFKPGYTITDTSGRGANDSCGNGGNGATGGDGGTNKSGGGGASGYVADSVIINHTIVGGNQEKKSKILFSNAPIPVSPSRNEFVITPAINGVTNWSLTDNGPLIFDGATHKEYTLVPLESTKIYAKMWGQGTGAKGGHSYGYIDLIANKTYQIRLDAGAGRGGTGFGWVGGGQPGGGYAGLFDGTVSQSNAIMIAGGSGGIGKGHSTVSGGGGGGTSGQRGQDSNNSQIGSRGGSGGTQSSGFRALQGGTGGTGQRRGYNNAGGGGGNDFGQTTRTSSGGGGGSGYINTQFVSEGVTSTFANENDPNRGTAGDQGKNSRIVITVN